MADEDRRSGPLAALWAVQLLFASLAVAGKYTLNAGLPPFTLAALRVAFASLLLSLVAWRWTREPVSPPDLLKILGLAVLGVAVNQLLFLKGLQLTSAVNATLLISTIPVFTLLVAVALRREHFNGLRALGVLVALGGALLLLRLEDFDASNRLLVGNVLVVLNSLSYSFYLVLSRPLLQRYRTMTVISWAFAFGALLMVPIGFPSLLGGGAEVAVRPDVLLVLAWIILGPSAAAYALNTYALKRLQASTVATYVFLQPLFGVFLALLLLPDESLTLRSAASGGLILLGVLFVSRTEARLVEPKLP